jgi:Na+/proline symporter
MAPVMVAALFWRRSTKVGALASTLWVAAWLILVGWLQRYSDGFAPRPGEPAVPVFSVLGHFFERSYANVLVHGFLPVVPMVLGSALCMVLGSLASSPPSPATIRRYFDTPDPETSVAHSAPQSSRASGVA